MPSTTALDAKGMDATGATYQRRALSILPVLVRHASSRQTIYYSALASELGIKNARTLNWPLGAVGKSLSDLSVEWEAPIPRIQALVVNKEDDLPGEGFMDAFIAPAILNAADRQLRKRAVDAMLIDVYTYPRWDAVLSHFGLVRLPTVPKSLIRGAATLFGGSESDAHLALKRFVATHPGTVGLPRTAAATIEYPLPSGDTVDVVFHTPSRRLAAEVKSRISSEADLVRGVFQCVKYEAVLDAVRRAEGSRHDVGAVLVVEGSLPPTVRRLATTLGVDVREGVTVTT